MRRALFLAVVFVFFSGIASAQRVLSRKGIYRVNCKAIVQIATDDSTHGVGFVVSSDGLIMTANHVVTTEESGFRKYGEDIKVVVGTKSYRAKPLSDSISDGQVNYDSAVIKIDASNLPRVTLGRWDDIEVGDDLTIITSWPGMGCIMLEGMASSKAAFLTPLGPKPVNTLIFQSPIRNGFSGSPIFDSYGRVVGIEDTKVFGISPSLGELRDKWAASGKQARISFMGIDLAGSFLELINNLDQNLISGLGSGVSIEYAKQQQEVEKKSAHGIRAPLVTAAR